jgi:hypothetical protein
MADINMFQKLPYHVYLQNKKYKINVDFRHIIQIENKIKDRSADNTEKICWCLEHFYPFFYKKSKYILYTNPLLFKEAVEKFKWFYKCGREEYRKASSSSSNNTRDLLSYEYDDEYIYGAFYERYKIDLTKDKVHWWKFRALLKSLHKTKINEIQSYRSYTGDNKDMLELKRFWELPLGKEEQERLDKLYDMLK